MMQKAAHAAPPRAPGRFLLGNSVEFMRAPLRWLTEWARRYGDVVDIRIPGERFHLVSDPDEIGRILRSRDEGLVKDRLTRDLKRVLGQGLVTSEGPLWKRQRRLVHSAFTPKRVRSYAELMVQHTERAVRDWRERPAVRDVHEDMSRLTLEIVSKSLFDADVGANAKEIGEALTIVSKWYADFLQLGVGPLGSLPIPRNLRFRRAIARIDEVLYEVIADRRAGDRGRDDLLSHLLRAQDEDGTRMDDEQLRDECVTLFLAGHETTALALTYCCYLLSKHPDVERRLHREIDEVLGDRSATAEDVPRLTYTRQVLKEAMRLYPPVWAIGREPTREMKVGGFHVPKGVQLVLSQWVVHHDPRWFPNPEGFDPARWEPERAASIPAHAYFPFGGGPRICIGNHFAMLEGVLLLATVARQIRLELMPGETLELMPSVTLRPKNGLRMRLRPREPRSASAAPRMREAG